MSIPRVCSAQTNSPRRSSSCRVIKSSKVNASARPSADALNKPYDGSITSSFGYRRNPFTGAGREFHSGVDFRGRVGDSIQTTGDGVVSFAGPKGGLGRCVIIEHNENLQTLYAHLHRVNVVKGQQVSSGEVIGFLGNTGRSTGPHLHYEIILNNKKINPTIYFNFETETGYD